jgi:osmotically-inducible protein OsmY
MTSDSEMMADLIGRLDAISSVEATELDVVVDNGMVTLNGLVDTHQTRFQIERAARKMVLHQFHCDFSLSLGESGFSTFPVRT